MDHTISFRKLEEMWGEADVRLSLMNVALGGTKEKSNKVVQTMS